MSEVVLIARTCRPNKGFPTSADTIATPLSPFQIVVHSSESNRPTDEKLKWADAEAFAPGHRPQTLK